MAHENTITGLWSPGQLAGIDLDAARAHLVRAREDLARAHRTQKPDRHFLGLRESPEVIQAYDAVREAEQAVARLERVSS